MSTAEQRHRWEQLAHHVGQLDLMSGADVPGEYVHELANAVLALVAELALPVDESSDRADVTTLVRQRDALAARVSRLRSQAAQLSEAYGVVRTQRQRLALRLSGLTDQDWEDVLASIGVERQTPRDPGPTSPVRPPEASFTKYRRAPMASIVAPVSVSHASRSASWCSTGWSA